MALAHSKNDLGVQHALLSHLQEVARLAASYAATLGAAERVCWAGLWPDPGKLEARSKARYIFEIAATRYNSSLGWIYVSTQVLRAQP